MKYLIYLISFLFVITFAGCDNAKNTKVDATAGQETAVVEKDNFKNRKCCKNKCENKEKCNKGKSCEHKCAKNDEKCKEYKRCESNDDCTKTKNAMKKHKCGEGKCGERKCVGNNLQKEIKEETDN